MIGSKAILNIQDYSFLCSLGCTAEERAEPQEVVISIQIGFSTLPKACESDSLGDTICYEQLCSLIKKGVATKSYQTIEYLAHEIYQQLNQTELNKLRWSLKLHKVKPPIAGLQNGVSFQMGHLL